MNLPVQIARADAPPSQTLMWRGCVAWALMGESIEICRQITSYAGSESGVQALASHPWLWSSVGAYWVLCLVIWSAAVMFARRPAALVPGLVALCGTGVLYEALTAAKGDVPEFLVHGGVLAG